jgi:hypothetical protein
LQPKNICIEEALDEGVLDDGWILGNLISAFTGQDVGKLDIPAKTRWKKLNNLTICFNFLEKEGVKLVGIGAEGTENFVGSYWPRYLGKKYKADSRVTLDLDLALSHQRQPSSNGICYSSGIR